MGNRRFVNSIGDCTYAAWHQTLGCFQVADERTFQRFYKLWLYAYSGKMQG